MTQSNINNSSAIYRYKLSDDIVKEITGFSKIHQYDDRVTYKEAWKIWREENSEYLNRERERLHTLGYEGSVEDKMFKAGRYYFRYKENAETQVKDAKQKRRNYISMEFDILNAMDIHIKKSMSDDDFSPAGGYNDFCEKHIDLLREEIERINKTYNITTKDITNKIKKTYKNRYYLLSRT